MNIGILDCSQGMAAYIHEITQIWGLRGQRTVKAGAIATLDPREVPILVCGAGDTADGHADAIAAYAKRGGNVIACLPGDALARAAGIRRTGTLDTPLRLRLSRLPVAGVAGDLLPVIGNAGAYEVTDVMSAVAHLSNVGSSAGEMPGIIDVPLGEGRLIAIAFDLPLSVRLCRQGDPAKANVVPSHFDQNNQCFRPCYMQSDLGGNDGSWLPHADLTARLLVDLIRIALPAPTPMLWHLPDGAAGVALYTGDEDTASLDHVHGQMRSIQRAGGRMNLYIIPEATESTLAHAQGYQKYHSLGPHPNLRPFDHEPPQVRIKDFTRQVKLFEDMFKVKTRSVRNHCVIWAGYTDMADEMARLGIRMEGNFNYGSYAYTRDPGPYVAWGAAMPMRHCRVDGTLVDVRQQHTHVGDDETFCDIPSVKYSFRLSADVYTTMLRRILGDCVERFHTPYVVNIHPGNWGKFSEPHSDALLAECARLKVPVLSFDMWSLFCDQRDAWTLDAWQWNEPTLQFQWTGQPSELPMHGLLPLTWRGKRLETLKLNGSPASINATRRHGEPAAMFALPTSTATINGEAIYQ